MKPKRTIRRFDVFAEYNKQEREEKGDPEPEAKGYGLWVAKVVASRRYGGAKAAGAERPGTEGEPQPHRAAGRPAWHLLDGEPQTDDLFEKEIVLRMGPDFYREVFAPAIRAARARGESYEAMRDALRQSWNA